MLKYYLVPCMGMTHQFFPLYLYASFFSQEMCIIVLREEKNGPPSHSGLSCEGGVVIHSEDN
jgi:hypothetical protein